MAKTEEQNRWPRLSYQQDHETFETLHLWAQIVGKIRLALTPWVNHSWHVPLYVSAAGLTTSLIPHPAANFDLEFDFIGGRLVLRTEASITAAVPFEPGSIAAFHTRVLDMLDSCRVPVVINGTPNELPEVIPFSQDVKFRRYDPAAARRLWQALLRMDAVFNRFRSGFLGKNSPVHFFWGSFDLAVTRFSGRPAPVHPGGIPNLPDDVVREAYSHEVSSAGFWPGGPLTPYPLFYSYCYPQPPDFPHAHNLPPGARFDPTLQEFVLAYDEVCNAEDPDRRLLDFLQATYEAAAVTARWDRRALECDFGEPGVVRDYKS